MLISASVYLWCGFCKCVHAWVFVFVGKFNAEWVFRNKTCYAFVNDCFKNSYSKLQLNMKIFSIVFPICIEFSNAMKDNYGKCGKHEKGSLNVSSNYADMRLNWTINSQQRSSVSQSANRSSSERVECRPFVLASFSLTATKLHHNISRCKGSLEDVVKETVLILFLLVAVTAAFA